MRIIGDGHTFAVLRQCADGPRTNERNERCINADERIRVSESFRQLQTNEIKEPTFVIRAGMNQMLSGDTNKNCFYLGRGSAGGGASFRSVDAKLDATQVCSNVELVTADGRFACISANAARQIVSERW